ADYPHHRVRTFQVARAPLWRRALIFGAQHARALVAARRGLWGMPWLDLAMLCGLTLLGLGLRLFDIDRESLWLDEAGRVAIALRPTWDIAHAVGVIELSPPLYHYALHAWIALAGDSDGAVRVLSALLVLPTVPLVASIGAVAGNRGSRLIAAALA